MADQQQTDAIDQFIALPKDERGKLFEQLAPEKQQALLGEIKKRKGAQPVTAPPVTPPAQTQDQPEADWRDKLTRVTPHQSDTPVHAVEDVFSNIGAGGLGVILHPVDTAMGLGKMAWDVSPPGAMVNAAIDLAHGRKPTNPVASTVDQFAKQPLESTEGLIGQTAVLDAAGEAVGPMAKTLKDTSAKFRDTVKESVTGTGPRVTKQLVKDTQDANAKSLEKHGEDVQKHQEAVRDVRKSNVDALNSHIAKLDEVAKDRTAGSAILDAREGLQKGVEDATKDVDVRIEEARHDALEEGNKKYNGVNEKLNHISADPEFVQGSLVDAMEKIKGTSTEPAIFKDMTRKLENGEVPTYEDLQGYYSELGKEISKGSLPGDVYHAFDTLHEAIGDEMQRIADSQGQGAELKAAREYWRRMKQTFGDTSDTVSDRAGKEVKEANPDAAKAQVSEYRRRLLGSFDPEIPKLLDAVDRGTQRLRDLPGETEGRKLAGAKPPEPPEPKPLPKKPELEQKKINTEDVQQAKEKALTARVKHLTAGLQWGAGGMAVFRILADVAHGNIGAVPSGLLEGGMAIGGIEMVSRLLENPKIVEGLTKVTAKDLAQIPPEMRGDLKVVVEEAQKKGIKVDPNLAALVGAAAVGPKTQELQRLRQSQ
jgi:hypothetical protein